MTEYTEAHHAMTKRVADEVAKLFLEHLILPPGALRLDMRLYQQLCGRRTFQAELTEIPKTIHFNTVDWYPRRPDGEVYLAGMPMMRTSAHKT